MACARGSHEQRLDRRFEIIPRTGRRGKVKNGVKAALDVERLGNVYRVELELRVADEHFEVPPRSAEKIVQADDGVAFREKALREMRSNEARRAAQ